VCLDHPRRVFGGLCYGLKFGAVISIICQFQYFKNTYPRPKHECYGEFDPTMGISVNATPKTHFFARKRIICLIDRMQAGRISMNKVKIKRRLRNHNMSQVSVECLPRPPTFNSATWICMCGHTLKYILRFIEIRSRVLDTQEGRNLPNVITGF